MPIYFRTTPVKEPYAFETLGNHWEQERVFRPAGHRFYHYLLTQEGCGQIVIQGKKHILNKGEGVLIAPFVSHSYAGISEKWITCFVTITGRMEGSIASILENRQVVFTNGEQGARISCIIEEMIRKYREFPAAVKPLSVDCYRLLMEFTDNADTRDFAENPLYIKYVAPTIKEIETEYTSRLTVQELSRKVYITPQYLSRLFVQFLGCSTYEYLTNYRISKAKELLRYRQRMEIQHIAQQVGFEEASHFIAMFRKKVGVTPHRFRDQF